MQDKKHIAKNIENHARYARGLFIWTDCDREGEHIGSEIRDVALKINGRLDVKRARFSNIERAYVAFSCSFVKITLPDQYRHVLQAAQNPIPLDERQAQAVAARIELDLRLGASFTRMQSLNLGPMIAHLQDERSVISYGTHVISFHKLFGV